MANELNIGVTLSFRKGGAIVDRVESGSFTVTGDSFNHDVQSIGTSEEQLAQGVDLGDPGFVFVKNLDATNYVEFGSTTGVYDLKLKAGEFHLYRHNSATIYAKANTASCLVEYIIIEN